MNEDFNNKKILVVRPDRIGDVVLSTPVLQTLRKKFPNAKIVFLVQDFLAPLLEGLDFIDEFLFFNVKKSKENLHTYFLELTKTLKEKKIDVAINLQSNAFLAASQFCAQIPVRIGPLSKLHSYLFYNKGIKQNRSKVLMHEAEYNLELLQYFGINKNEYVKDTAVFLKKKELQRANEKILNIYPQFDPKKSVIIHAGMRGSALNWPIKNYKLLAQHLAELGYFIILTAGESEQHVLDEFKELESYSNISFWGGSSSPMSLSELAALIFQANILIAPSTGPLHIGVALKKNVISFYPHIKVQSEKRWGPFTEARDSVCVFTPHAGSDKMESIKVDDVIKKVESFYKKTV